MTNFRPGTCPAASGATQPPWLLASADLPRIDARLGYQEPRRRGCVFGLNADTGRRGQLAGEHSGGGANAALVEGQHREAHAQVDVLYVTANERLPCR
jgi:hypothetical protein